MYVVISTPQNKINRDTLWLAGVVRQLRFGFYQMGRLVSRPLKGGEKQTRIAVLLLLFAALYSSEARAQQVETSLPLSQRFTINLAAGVPEYIGDATSTSNAPQSQWWYENTRDSATYSIANFTESSDGSANWQQVGLPYDANIPRTFINQTSGGGQGSLTGNQNWYRLHFKVDPKYASQKFMLEIEGSHTGVQVYINGTLLPGISAVAANANATHVVGFVPVAVDLTPYLHADGRTDNVIAIDVSRGSTWFEQPSFSGAFRFGQAMAGLFRNVKLFVTNPVHIPINVYSNQKTWGTYVGTVSITPAAGGTATAASAVVEVQTNVLNESATAQQVTLTTQIVDANGDVVVTAPPVTQSVPPMTAATFPSTATPMFQQQITVPNPTLWYPNNSNYGKPYMYKVYHIVSVSGVVVDSVQSPLGIRIITWDSNFPSFNGHPMHLWGASGRYDYPALGSAVPDEQVWRDLAQFAASGGNIWRPGHSTSSEEFVEAADAYGIMIDQPSGDGEGSFTNPSADNTTLKTEIHRDMIIRDRSHPSILDWEEDNGGNNLSLVSTLASLEAQWDNINPREQATRAYLPSYSNYVGIDECDGVGCESGIKQTYPSKPAFGAEYWDNIGTGRGLAWDNELAFAAPYLKAWREGRANNTFGMAQWYFADTPGEVSLFSEDQKTVDTRIDPTTSKQVDLANYVRSLGYSMVDQNRFPKLLYYIYEANWTPYSVKPVVELAHHWNRAYEYQNGIPIQENAFSNCPAVRLLINGVNKDPLTGAILADQTPNPWNIQVGDLTQNTTVMPGQVHWMVNWAPGTVMAQCIDANGNAVSNVADSRTTAGTENKIVLTVVPELQKPDGTSFQWTSNGSDAAFVVAQVQDAQGNIVPTAADNVTFTVTGPATYMGGTQQRVASPLFTNYYQDAFSQANSNVINGVPYAFFHSPGDPELNFEGGLQKIALRSTFTPGTVTVTASAPGLASGSVQLSSVAPPAPVQSQAPAIIVPPVSTSVTAGKSATFTVAASGSGALNYQWYMGTTAIAGATGTSYTTPATTLADNNETFMVTVTSAGGYGAVTSNPATLSVVAPVNAAITTQPASQTAVVGQTATLSVVASGSPQLNYAWYEENVLVAYGAQNTFTTPVLTAAGTHTFYVVVSNPLNSVQSSNAVLTVNAATPVSFVTQPASLIAATNQPVQLTAVVAGSAPYTYQWQFTPKGGSTTIVASNTQLSNTISYLIPAMNAANVGAYTVTVNNAANVPVTSAAAQLTLAPPGNNLALGRSATSSSTQNACNDGTTAPPYSGVGCLGAEDAVDGNLTSRWGSATAGAPPTTLVPGVDPSWLQVDLGSVQSFNTVVITWENASAAQYQIQYTSETPTANTVWSIATTNNAGAGGTETLTFPTVQARYVRLYGTQRNTQYGYSLFEFQVYNIAQLGASTERYSPSPTNASLVRDNLLGLTWTSSIKTNTAIGSQFTGVDAAAYCSSIGMRLPTQAEALDISGINNSSNAFPGPWNTWTSTVDPNDANQTAIVGFDGSVAEKVTVNWPGETLCTLGTSSAQAAVIQAQPQAHTATVGQSAMFTVAATGTPAPSYQWLENGINIPGATSATYITPPTASTDNGATFNVIVSNGESAINSTSAGLTVSTNPVPPPPNPNPNPGNGNTGPNDTAVPGFGTGPVPAGPNLALGAKATSLADENTQVYPPSAANDGNLTTRWSSAFADAEWIQLDLGSVQSIGQVVLRWERGYGSQYQIQVSTDGQTWTTACNQTNGQGGSENLVFPAVIGRYVRMNGVLRASNYGYSLWEFEVYGPVGPAIATQPVSQTVVAGAQAQFTVVAGGTGPFTYQWLRGGVAIPGATSATYTTAALSSIDSSSVFSVVVSNAGGSVTSSSVSVTVTNPTPGVANLALNKSATSSPNENANLAALNAVDGNLTTRWSSAFVDPSWIEIDLGSPLLINKVVLYWEASYGAAYQIQVSNDEQTWTPVYTQTAGKGGVDTLTFPAVIDRYIRMYGTAKATQYGYSLYEFQVYGADVPSIVTQPASQAVNAGSTATFNVVAGGDGPFTYQWLRNGVAIAGATATGYTTPVLMSGDSGSTFTVSVTNSTGTTTSAKALLTVQSTAPTGPNLALNQPAKESASQNDATLGQALAVDGNLATRWASASADPSWIYVDLGTAKTVNQVILRWEAAYGKAYQIQVSNDAQTWTPVFTQTAGQGGVENISFAPVSARFVRMYGTVRGTPYGYSLYEFEVYGPATALTITTQPANQSANVGSTATFTVVAGGTGPFTYQWFKNQVLIPGATSASYTTPVLASSDNGGLYSVTVGNAAGTGTVTSSSATLSVGSYTIYPGFIGVDLNNNTKGRWTNDQVFVTVIGIDPSTNKFAYLTADGTIVDFTLNDSSAANHLTHGGKNYGNYSFTLAQSTLLKIPPFGSARAYISLGAPLYIQVNGDASGNVTGYAGPNPQNGTDPNINTYFDWYEFNVAGNGSIYINTTQVDEFGLPLTLDVWGSAGTFHQQVGITESIAQLDSEFANEVPAQFQPPTMSNLRIFSPAKLSLAAGAANGNYFDSYVAGAWSSYATTPVSITLNGRQFTGTASGTNLTFNEVNPSSAHVGETFVVQQPSTQDILGCAGTMATGVPGTTPQLQDENAVQLQLQNQICSAINRHVLLTPANWASASAYYGAAPANFYSEFWHNHSIGGLAYGFSYDDNNNQSTTIATPQPEHMAFGIGW
ncbi:MAG: coagulation factor 5/8 type domain protein [Edaphobacter sp.]|nr:coagulation factor 5/8 type domain protein [Edaphobacter sp.]